MRRKWIVMTLLSGMIMTSLVACKGDKVGQSTEQSSEVVSEAETEEVTEKEESNDNAEQIIEETSDSDALKFMYNPEMENMSKEEIIDRMMYAITHQIVALKSRGAEDVKEIDNYFAVTTAVFHSEYYEGFYAEDPDPDMNYAMKVDDEILQQSMKDLFGKEYSVEEYISNGIFDNAIYEKNGDLYYGIGDWGTDYPDFKLDSLDGTSVTGRTVWVYENLGTEELVAYVTATISENADSQYGYVIESLTVDYVE